MSESEPPLPPIPSRPAEAHKGTMGRVLLVAGSRGMAGAAALAAEAALRGGAGYAVVACPGSIAPEMTAAVPGALLRLCGESTRETLLAEDGPALAEEMTKAQSLVLGPGLGMEESTGRLVLDLVCRADLPLPMVLDADGLNHLACAEAAPRLPDSAILTPHPGEAAKLLGLDSAARVQEDRDAALAHLVEKFGAVVLLKGKDTLVGAPSLPPWTNRTGNPGMATAGSGDVLSGLLGALLARGLSPWDAARLAAHLHGQAGDACAARLGRESMLASDILEDLPRAILDFQCSSS